MEYQAMKKTSKPQSAWWKKAFNTQQLRSYFSNHQGATEEEVSFITSVGHPQKQATILDLCCGYGRHAIALSKKGYSNIVGIDASESFIKLARSIAKKEKLKIRFLYQDVRKASFPEESFDFIYCMYTSFGYFSDKENREFVRKISSWLKPDGVFILDVMNAELLFSDMLQEGKETKSGTFVRERKYTSDKVDYLDVDEYAPLTGQVKLERSWRTKSEKGMYSFNIIHYTLPQFRQMFKENHLLITKIYGDYRKTKWSTKTPRKIIVSKKRKNQISLLEDIFSRLSVGL